MSIYPTAIPSIAQVFDYIDDVDWINENKWDVMRDELIACLTELGTLPKGNAADLKTRLAISLDADGNLQTSLTPTFAGLTIGVLQWNSGDYIDGTQVADADLGDISVATGVWTVKDDSHAHVIANIDTFSKADLEGRLTDVANLAEADGDVYSGVHDFGDVTSLEIPQDATVDAVGKISLDTTDKALVIHDGTSAKVYAHPLYQTCFTIFAGTDWTADEIPIWTAPKDMAITIVQVHAVVMGTDTPILTYNIEERAKGSIGSAGTDIYASDQTADASGEDEASFSNAGIAAGAHLVLVPSAESGTVTLIHGVIYYTKNVE